MRVLWLVAVAMGFGYAIATEWTNVRSALTDLELWRVVAATGVGLVGVGVSAQIWRSLMVGLGAPLSTRAAIRIFFVGQLGKYLPGSVWPVLAQMELGKDHGVAPRTSAAGVAVFLWVHLCTGAALACVVVPLTSDVPALVVLGAPVALALLMPAVLGRALALAVRVTRRPALPQVPGGRAIATACAWAVLMWICYGLHLWWLVDGASPGTAANPVAMIGAFAAAWCLGFLFLVAPAGAGAREAVLLTLLPLTTGPALAVVVVSRVLLTVADGLWGSLGAFSAPRLSARTR